MSTGFKTKALSNWSTPLLLLVVSILAYGLLIPSLGFYWDDLPYLFVYQRLGPAGYPDFVASDRPHSAWVFMGLTWLLGENPLGYHIFGLLLFWVCALLFWELIRGLWPDHQKEALWAALLFAVYPGFLGQPKTIIYNHHFIAMALYLFSLIGTFKAVHKAQAAGGWLKAWFWHLPALLATGISQFTIEYYIGWEAVRMFAVWLVLTRRIPNLKQRLKHSLFHLLPYWLVTLSFLVWRVFIFRFPTYQPIGGTGTNFSSPNWWLGLASQVFDAVFAVWGYAWPQLSSQDFSQNFWLAYLILTIFSMVLIFLLLWKVKFTPNDVNKGDHQESQQTFFPSSLWMALIGIGFAGWPFWLVNLQLNIAEHFRSRFTLAFIPWAALLMAALLHKVAAMRWRRSKLLATCLIAFLVGGSIGWHFWNANFYRNQWVDLQRYLQQLVRRVPDLEPGTILLINDLQSLSLYQDDSLTVLLNMIYAPEDQSLQLDYAVFYLSVRLGREFPALEAGYPINKAYRSFDFSSSTDNMLVVHSEPPGCLRVLNPGKPDRIPLYLPGRMFEALPLSNLDLIRTDAAPGATLPAGLFEESESESWCLFFQDAELAAQRGDWNRVAEIGQRAYARVDLANELSEHFVFIDGFLRAGLVEQAYTISKMVSETANGRLLGRICGTWRGAGVETGAGSYYQQLCQGD